MKKTTIAIALVISLTYITNVFSSSGFTQRNKTTCNILSNLDENFNEADMRYLLRYKKKLVEYDKRSKNFPEFLSKSLERIAKFNINIQQVNMIKEKYPLDQAVQFSTDDYFEIAKDVFDIIDLKPELTSKELSITKISILLTKEMRYLRKNIHYLENNTPQFSNHFLSIEKIKSLSCRNEINRQNRHEIVMKLMNISTYSWLNFDEQKIVHRIAKKYMFR